MAEGVPPQITIQPPGVDPAPVLQDRTSSSPEGVTDRRKGRLYATNAIESRPIPNGLRLPDKIIRTLADHGNTDGHATSSEGRRDLHSAIDPLSQRIIGRTSPERTQTQKAHMVAADEEEPAIADSALPARTAPEPSVTRTDTANSATKGKKKGGVSFLSRFIGSKKKDPPADTLDDDSDADDKRVEGTDADLFLQPIGFIPKFPAPPKYIKIRSRGKKEKDFNRVFLAQELKGLTGVEIAQAGGRSVNGGPIHPLDKSKNGKAIWAMEFSKDGRYLAAGGHDHIVRVWGTIATQEDRQTHEKAEDVASNDGTYTRLSAPVFKTRPVREYEGHTASVLDLSWSKNNFLLSSAMDKTVRLWHASRAECLCCFKHKDFVTSIQFHPRDDRFFLAGSMDSKLRLWSIPDKNVAFWSQLNDIITSVAFSPDGKVAIAGCLTGQCLFFETEGLKYQTQMLVRSAHGKNAKGSKVTGIQAFNYPPNDPRGEVKLIVTTNDSRVRVYNLRDKGLELKLKGNENISSQIRATISDDAKYVICGSEDKKVYIWSTGPPEKDKDKHPVEMFEAHSAIVTAAIMAPTATRQLLQSSGDPLYNLCNPPPVTLLSRTESQSSCPPTENGHHVNGSVPPTPVTAEFVPKATKPGESPAYIARSVHMDGNIIVTADYIGQIKVFRQDCAYQKRLHAETWDTSSTFSKKMLNRNSSVVTRHSRSSQRNSSTYPSSERILSWRQSIERSNGSHELVGQYTPIRNSFPRGVSPQKPIGLAFLRDQSHSTSAANTTPSISMTNTSNPPSIYKPSLDSASIHARKATSDIPEDDPLVLQGMQSAKFWDKSQYIESANSIQRVRTTDIDGNSVGGGKSGSLDSVDGLLRPDDRDQRRNSTGGRSSMSRVSALSSDFSSDVGDGSVEAEEEVRCKKCGGESFRARVAAGGEKRLECTECGTLG